MSSIPTAYNGINFRSRAEARWAAFFDFAGWEWDYEPIDLDGYIPDFVLRWYKPLLVEIKGGALDLADLEPHTAKVEDSSWQGNALLLAAIPERGGSLGLLSDRYVPPGDFGCTGGVCWAWAGAMPIRCKFCGKSSINSEWHSFVCRRCGGYDGDSQHGTWSPTRDWSDACNATQWMPGVPRIYAPRIQAPR